MSDVNIEKITNAAWVVHLGPLVEKFVQRAELPNVSYHSLVHVLQERAQFGGEAVELWVARNETETFGWASWRVALPPLIATVYWDYLYTIGNRKDITRMFAAEFIRFKNKHNAIYIKMDVTKHGKVLKHFQEMAKEQGYEMNLQSYYPCLATNVDYYKKSLREGEQDG